MVDSSDYARNVAKLYEEDTVQLDSFILCPSCREVLIDKDHYAKCGACERLYPTDSKITWKTTLLQELISNPDFTIEEALNLLRTFNDK